MDGTVCVTQSKNYVYDHLINFAKIHNIDLSDVDFWYNTFLSYNNELINDRIEYGDRDEAINIDKSIMVMEDILSRKYG